MPRKKSQLSQHTSKARNTKIRRYEEPSTENVNRHSSLKEYASQVRVGETSAERSQRLSDNNYRIMQFRARESFGTEAKTTT